MSEFKNPTFWLALLVWGIAMFLSVATVWAVSGLDARTWPAFTLEPTWSGPSSESNQAGFVGLFTSALAFLFLAGEIWGRVFEFHFGKNRFAKVALIGGIASTGGFLLHAAAWRITMWLEDMGYYVQHPNDFDFAVSMISFCVWVLGGLTFIVFSIQAANKLGKR